MVALCSPQLLLQICGSRENYRYTRDLHSLHRYIGSITDTCRSAGFNPDKASPVVPLNLGYKAMLGLIEQLRLCAEVVATRTNNWQVYCLKEKGQGKKEQLGKEEWNLNSFPLTAFESVFQY